MTDESAQPDTIAQRFDLSRLVAYLLLGIAAIFFALHFLHLDADFPNHSPWVDWSKYTDEGWYGDAAIRHYLTGHWYWPGDFNPAVALPVWPAIELVFFKFSGVSPVAARTLTLFVFALTLFTFYRLIERHAHQPTARSGRSLAAPLTVFLLCVSPFLYVFERMAILEPLLIALTALALLTASHLHPLPKLSSRPQSERSEDEVERSPHLFSLAAVRRLCPALALGLLLPAMVLTKTTGIFLFPGIAYMVWARAGYRLRPAIRLALLPAVIAPLVWIAYFFLFVRPYYLLDYQYLFTANSYSGILLSPPTTVILHTLTDGFWIGKVLYPAFFLLLALALFWRPHLFKNPLIPALGLWTAGYFAFLAYHNNLQPRYYLVVAVPVTALVALGLDNFRQARGRAGILASTLTVAVVLAIAIPDAILQLDFVMHPTYEFEAAAHAIARVVRADPTHPKLLLSISGSDITMMTGLPSIDDDFGTLELPDRVKQYRPGWYAAWNELDDDKMDALTPLYHVERVAEFPAMDDPDRNLLILYRLDPTIQTPVVRTHKPRTPKPLMTKLGQQPTTQQLQH